MSSISSISEKQTNYNLHQKMTLFYDKNISTICKPLILTGVLLFLFYILVSNNRHFDQPSQYLAILRQKTQPLLIDHNNNNYFEKSNTSINHIVIGIAGSVDAYKYRRPYIESWWRQNVTKGYLFVDREPTSFLPWPSSSPPYIIYDNTTRYKPYDKHPMRQTIRIARVIVQLLRELNDESIRWFVLGDDDTILFLDNLVDVLRKYDHTKYVYIGENSETIQSNIDNSFEMAFGGAGFAISYPLAEALAKNMDVCIKRYPSLYGSDHLMQSCVADLGVSLTHEKGFHQIDLRRDLWGFLSSHPQAPVVSLHHLDAVYPIFPNMPRSEALNHLMKAARADESRVLQQSICYDTSKNWSFSIAWGYTAEFYEKIIPPSLLQKPLETFGAWRKPSRTPFMFNTRWLTRDPCDIPHMFYFELVSNNTEKDLIVTSYTRKIPRNLPPCSSSTSPRNRSGSSILLNDIAKIIVVSPATKYVAGVGSRRECCDVLDQAEKNITTIKFRACMKNEIVGVD